MPVSKENDLTHKAKDASTCSVAAMVKQAKLAAQTVAGLTNTQRNDALLSIAAEIRKNEAPILQANQVDLNKAEVLCKQGKLTQALLDRLKLDKNKLAAIITGIKQIAAMPDPIGETKLARELDQGLELYRLTCPIGLIGVIFEARPDALPQIASLCLKSANAVILKGGTEAENSNRALFDCLQKATVGAGIPTDAMVLLESREDIAELLKAEDYVDLIIPRGSNALVKYIQSNTNIPVLGHAEGVCHVYVDKAADLAKALTVVFDAKTQYPSACNAVETLLVHRDVAQEFLPKVSAKLCQAGVSLRCDAASAQFVKDSEAATEEDWRTEYGDLVLSIKIVDSLDEAIKHINKYGSAHTEAMISEDQNAFAKFFAEVNSAGIFLNASTRFADGFRYGFGAEVGISTGKMHPRGPVGIEGLVTYKYKLIGNGHVVSEYVGPNAKRFTHREIGPRINQIQEDF